MQGPITTTQATESDYAMNSWWEMGEWSGRSGNDLAIHEIECAFCFERGNFTVEHHAAKRKANESKMLNFDSLRCGNCGVKY